MTTKQAWICFWLVGIIWGSSYLFISVAVEQIPPFEVVFIRTGIAAIGLCAVVYLRGKRLPTDWAGIRDVLFLGVVNTVFPFALITWGETSVESGLAGVLQSAAALFTLVIASFVFPDERITLRKVLGLALGFLGIIVLASRSWQNGQVMTSDLIGQLAIIGASLCYAIGGTYSRKAIQNRLEPIVAAAGTMTVAAIITGIITFISPLFGGKPFVPPSEMRQDILLDVLVLGFLNTFVAYTMFYSLVRALGAARTSMVTYIIPPVSLFLGAIFLDEVVDILLIIGAILIVGGIAIVNLNFARWLRLGKPAIVTPEPVKDVSH